MGISPRSVASGDMTIVLCYVNAASLTEAKCEQASGGMRITNIKFSIRMPSAEMR